MKLEKVKMQKGFTVIEGLLIAVIVGILGFAGWYVWHSNKSANHALSNAMSVGSAVSKPTPTTPVSQTASWKTYTSTIGKYSFKYPASWTVQDCGDTVLLMAASAKYLGNCDTSGSNNSGYSQMDALASPGDMRQLIAPSALDNCKNVKQTAVVTDKVSGIKYECSLPYGDMAGTKVTAYIYYDGSETYEFEYFGLKGAPDLLNEFNILVNQTLKLSE